MKDINYGKIESSNFLITGGAGFIGSNIAEFLLKNGALKVRVLDDLSTGYLKNIEKFLENEDFEFIKGDIRDLETCRKAVHGIDIVLHQAALGSVPRSIADPITANDVNIGGFLNMLVAARDAKVERFVYAASSATYGDSLELPKRENKIGNPLSPYAITKYANELYAENFMLQYGFPSIGLRYFNVFGPKQDPNGAYAAIIPIFMDSILRDESPTINGDGEQTRDFTYIDNVIQANLLAAFAGWGDITKPAVFNVACGQNISINQLFAVVNELGGKNIKPIYGEPRAGDVRDSLADIAKIKAELGYEPTVYTQEGLKRAFDWYSKNI